MFSVDMLVNPLTLQFYVTLIDSQYMNDLWRFNIKEAIWKKLNPIGDIPEKRSNHSAVYDTILKRLTIYDKPGLI